MVQGQSIIIDAIRSVARRKIEPILLGCEADIDSALANLHKVCQLTWCLSRSVPWRIQILWTCSLISRMMPIKGASNLKPLDSIEADL